MGDININFEGGVSCNDQWQAVVDSLQLTQVITSPTRVTATTEIIIDHIYTTHPQHVCASKVGLLSASDHFPVIMIRKCNYARVDTPSVITFNKRFNKSAIQGTPQMAVDKEAICLSRVYSYYPKCNFPLFYV